MPQEADDDHQAVPEMDPEGLHVVEPQWDRDVSVDQAFPETDPEGLHVVEPQWDRDVSVDDEPKEMAHASERVSQKASKNEGGQQNRTLPAAGSSAQPYWHCVKTVPERCPRLSAVFCAIILPLWVLICIALLCGSLLASQEAPREYENNDFILANRFSDDFFDLDETIARLLLLPGQCLGDFMLRTRIGETNFTLEDIAPRDGSPFDGLSEQDILWLDIMQGSFADLREHMDTCGENMSSFVETIYELRAVNVSTDVVAQSLSFNWIRCWNATELGPRNVMKPTLPQLRAAANQSDFYAISWDLDRQRLMDEYVAELGDGISSRNRLDALGRAVSEATGQDDCSENGTGTAWFWFTIMTTVGYGNQAPVTAEGRAMVSSLGFVSILVFAGILANAGSIVLTLFEDAVGRSRLRFLSHPLGGCVFWCGIATAWTFYLANYTLEWWRRRLDGFDATDWDSVWFAYVSTTTIGLGDFYLQPEVIFGIDVFVFSLLFLTGFVFLSTFLNQLGELLGGILPDAGKKLRDRLKRTGPLTMAVDESEPVDTKTLETLKELVKQSESHSHPEIQDMAAIVEEEEVLNKLVELKIEERLNMLRQEEELLKKLVERKTAERLLIESDASRKSISHIISSGDPVTPYTSVSS